MDLKTATEKVIDYFTKNTDGCIHGESGIPFKGIVGAILAFAAGIANEETYYNDRGEPVPDDIIEALETIFDEVRPYANNEYYLDIITTAYLLLDERTGDVYTLIKEYYMEDVDGPDIVICLEKGIREFE